MKIDGIDIFIREHIANSILSKILKWNKEYLEIYVSPLKPFGFRGYFIKDDKFKNKIDGLINPVVCYGKGVIGYVENSEVEVRREWINKWKVFTARANNIGTELKDDNFNTIVGKPNTVCTETYIVIGADLELNEKSANNLSRYLKTKFARYLHSLSKSSQDAARNTYRFIPVQNFSDEGDIDWEKSSREIDFQLYEKYGFSNEERKNIEFKIKDM